MTPCNLPLRNAEPCRYPGNRCPLHPRPELHTSETGTQPAPPTSKPGVHELMRDALNRLRTGQTSALASGRYMRGILAFHKLGFEPLEEDEVLAEIELRGCLMHGLPPRNQEEWDLAREKFDDEAIAEFERWQRLIDIRRVGRLDIEIQAFDGPKDYHPLMIQAYEHPGRYNEPPEGLDPVDNYEAWAANLHAPEPPTPHREIPPDFNDPRGDGWH
jgi:hypothetical protein